MVPLFIETLSTMLDSHSVVVLCKVRPTQPRTHIKEILRIELEGHEEILMKLDVHALPADGAANEELLSFLAKLLHTEVSLLSGATSRMKRVSCKKRV